MRETKVFDGENLGGGGGLGELIYEAGVEYILYVRTILHEILFLYYLETLNCQIQL